MYYWHARVTLTVFFSFFGDGAHDFFAWLTKTTWHSQQKLVPDDNTHDTIRTAVRTQNLTYERNAIPPFTNLFIYLLLNDENWKYTHDPFLYTYNKRV